MKSLRFYFVAALVWLLAGLTLVACSKKETNGGCTDPYMCSNYPNYPNYPGSYPGPVSMGYIPNGKIVNSSNFRDLAIRYTYLNWHYGGYGENLAQVKILNAYGSQVTIVIQSPEIGGGAFRLTGEKFKYDNDARTFYQVWYYNPQRYKIAELEISGDLATATAVPYRMKYYRNANDVEGVVIIQDGYLKKGIDF